MKRSHVGFLGKATWLLGLLVLFALTGCHLLNKHRVVTEPVRLPYKVAGASDTAIMTLQDRLNQQGIQVITIGQDYMITIPSDRLFPNESPRLVWRGYPLLNDVACYLKQFRKVAVQVTAFSNQCVSAKRDHALTLARARAVGNYLWSQGVDSRFIFTQGLGSDKPIVSFSRKGDQFPNSRIEIIFRDAVA